MYSIFIVTIKGKISDFSVLRNIYFISTSQDYVIKIITLNLVAGQTSVC